MSKLICFKIKEIGADDTAYQYHRLSKRVADEILESERYVLKFIPKSTFKKVMLNIQKREDYYVVKPKYQIKSRKSRLSSNRKLKNGEVKGSLITFRDFKNNTFEYAVWTEAQKAMLHKRHSDCMYSIQGGLIIRPSKIGDDRKNPFEIKKNHKINVPAKSKHAHTLSIQYYDGQTIHMKVKDEARAVDIFTKRYGPIHRVPGLYNITAGVYMNRITGKRIDLINNSN